MAQLIRIDGSEETVKPQNGQSFELPELYALVGDPIDVLELPSKQLLVIDDEGKFKGKARNDRASLLGASAGIGPADYVVGDVLVCEPSELE